MIRTRTIHSNRKTPYRINLKGREKGDSLLIQIYLEDGTMIFQQNIPPDILYGIKNLYFRYLNGTIVWNKNSERIVL